MIEDYERAFRDVALILRLAADDFEQLADDFGVLSVDEAVAQITRISLQTDAAMSTAVRPIS